RSSRRQNPAQLRGHLNHLLPSHRQLRKLRPVRHHPALPYAELPAFMDKVRGRNGIAPRALEFLILTSSRLREMLGVRFDEIDFATKQWTVPGERMKGGREHRVPLSRRAIAIVEEMAEIQQNELVFPGMKQGVLSNMTLQRLCHEQGARAAR